MVICDADRFGISQLHQLRGRIGRGGHPGVCLLLTGSTAGLARPRSARRRGRAPATASCWPRSTSSSAARATCSAPSQSGGRSSLRLLRVLADADLIVVRPRRWPRPASNADPELTDPGLADIVDAGRAPGRRRLAGRHDREVARDPDHRRDRAGGRRLAHAARRPDPADHRPGARGALLGVGLVGGRLVRAGRRRARRAGLLRPVRRLRSGRAGGGQPRRRTGAAGRVATDGPPRTTGSNVADARALDVAGAHASGSRTARRQPAYPFDIVFLDPPYELAAT